MAKDKDKNTEIPKSESLPRQEVKKYPLEVLKNACGRLFCVSAGTFDAATKGLKDKEYSKDEMKSHIEKWLKQEVKK